MPRLSGNNGSGKRITAAERQAQALALRKVGVTYEKIATELGYASASGAQKAVVSALRKVITEPAEELRQLELSRLDALLLSLWPAASKGSVGAVDRVLKIMERRAAYLGLDAPKRLDVSLEQLAERAAAEAGLDSRAVLAEAEAWLKDGR